MIDIFSKGENRLFSLIDRIRPRPAMYLGENSLSFLRQHLLGYILACTDYQLDEDNKTDSDISFLPLGIFQTWLAVKYDNSCSAGYDGIILMANGLDEARALDAFFIDWDEFLAQDHEMLKRDFLDENGQVIFYPDKYRRESHYYSIYLLTDTRSAKKLRGFLEQNIKTYTGTLESNLFFPYNTCTHKVGEREIVFRSMGEVFDYFEKNNERIDLHVSNYDYSEEAQGLRRVAITYTEDGHTIINLDIIIPGPQMTNMDFTKDIRIVGWANTIKQYFDSNLILYAYCDYDNPPPKNKMEFMNRMRM